MEFLFERKQLRLSKYDYSSPGYYFVTICTTKKGNTFGKIRDNKMILNNAGKIAFNEWIKTKDIRNNVDLDNFVIMPDHLHGIIIICRGVSQYAPTPLFRSPSQTLGAIVRGYKSSVTKQIKQLYENPGRTIWQRSFYDHIIRNGKDLARIRKYIKYNLHKRK